MSDSELGRTLQWTDISVQIGNKDILKHLTGSIRCGELLAVMGPSGAGKSTFLDVIAGRRIPSEGTATLNGTPVQKLKQGSISYVEQHDALFGVLTVDETIRYSARLCNPKLKSKEIDQMVQNTLGMLGLQSVAKQKIGTPISRGISGGQKRRVTIGCALVGSPALLLLDEPTSGLDSLSGREVIRALKGIARISGIPIICSIHQPNWETFSLFDSVLVLAAGRTIYAGPVQNLSGYLTTRMEVEVPTHANPADRIITALNADFGRRAGAVGGGAATRSREEGNAIEKTVEPSLNTEISANESENEEFQTPEMYANTWDQHGVLPHNGDRGDINAELSGYTPTSQQPISAGSRSHLFLKSVILTERNFVNYSRNVLGYGVRLGMYLGMGVLLATIWVNLGDSSTKINDRLSVHFFSVAFLGFMSVAGIPAFLEERHVFLRERMNGLYTPLPYVVANSMVAIPFLALCAMVFSLLSYWSIGLHPGAGHFFKFFLELFLAVYVAESQSILVAAILPIFVAALAVASFFNGFWMCVQGYFIRAVNLPRFWYWWAHWIDYQTFAFNFLVNNDLRGLTFPCPSANGSCVCPYPSSLPVDQCALRGEDVLNALQIGGINLGLYAGLLIVIALVFRALLWAVLVLKKH